MDEASVISAAADFVQRVVRFRSTYPFSEDDESSVVANRVGPCTWPGRPRNTNESPLYAALATGFPRRNPCCNCLVMMDTLGRVAKLVGLSLFGALLVYALLSLLT